MYPFERYLRRLKNNVTNKAKVKRSICNAYLVEEALSFCAHYFQPHVYTRHRKMPRNDDSDEVIGKNMNGCSPFSEIRDDHMVERDLDSFLMIKNIIQHAHIFC